MTVIHYIINSELIYGKTEDYPPSVYADVLEAHFPASALWRVLRSLELEGLVAPIAHVDRSGRHFGLGDQALAVSLTIKGVSRLIDEGNFDARFLVFVADIEAHSVMESGTELRALASAFRLWADANWTFAPPPRVCDLDSMGILS